MPSRIPHACASPPSATCTAPRTPPARCAASSRRRPRRPTCCCCAATSPTTACPRRPACWPTSWPSSRCRSSPCSATTTSSRAQPDEVRRDPRATPACACSTARRARSHGVGFAGVKGFAGGFGRGALGAWGERRDQAVRQRGDPRGAEARVGARQAAHAAAHRAAALLADRRRRSKASRSEIFPFLGSSRLEEPLLRYPVDAVFHGHAHRGTPEGTHRQRRAGLQRGDAAAEARLSGAAAVPRVRDRAHAGESGRVKRATPVFTARRAAPARSAATARRRARRAAPARRRTSGRRTAARSAARPEVRPQGIVQAGCCVRLNG